MCVVITVAVVMLLRDFASYGEILNIVRKGAECYEYVCCCLTIVMDIMLMNLGTYWIKF